MLRTRPSGRPVAKEIGIELGLDAGYLSRIVQNFDENGLITRKPLESDRRQYRLGLTAKGRQAFAKLESSSKDDVGVMLAALPSGGSQKLVGAMAEIERLLGKTNASSPPAILRGHHPGDMGWVVQSHGALYASEYGFDSSFEALVAEIAAKFLTWFDASRERCWIAELDGAPSDRSFWCGTRTTSPNCVCCWSIRPGADMGSDDASSPNASRSRAGLRYRKITLWTQSILVAARKIYQDAGFVPVASEPHRSFGQSLIGETWEREL